MSLLSPVEGWYSKKVSKDEKMWIAISFALCVILFVWMVLWHVFGNQNPSNTTYRTSPAEYIKLYEAYVKKNSRGNDNGIPVVMPEPNSDVIMLAQMWRWSPVLILKKDEWYNIHLSSADLLHGFSLQPVNMNFMVFPGYDYVLRFRPNAVGEYKVLCNEFCGIGHHTMIGKIVVIENEADLEKYGYTKDKLSAPNTATAVTDTTTAATTGEMAEAEMVKAGEQLYALKGCNACHKLDGTNQLAPSFKGLWNTTAKVKENGQEKEMLIDEAYVQSSILTPQKHITVGFEQTIMPTMPVTEDEIKQLTAFIKSQKN
ncbi:hypothetical protein C7N43_20100 [Sphingobacteriales bacterium UPWRP_1]|nr:hypothetical protein BVG80_02490 [Sphingobacteriales bacterium TSM_CSM]PSJ75224.1 hypothetical protein C7N43_20100 [Sphingobacteriales bacterium UPWRP_1]